MLSSRVPLTDKLVCHIQDIRTGNVIGAAKLTEMIGKPPGYISALENRRIKSISAPLLIKIFRVLHENLSDEEIVEKIESIINAPKVEDASVGDNVTVTDYEKKEKYTLGDDYDNPYLIENLLSTLSVPFNAYYKKEPKDTVYTVATLLTSMQFDIVLMMKLLNLPIFLLKPLVIEERQIFLDDIGQVFQKHLSIAKDKKDNSEETPAE